jgi:hypothetical protein
VTVLAHCLHTTQNIQLINDLTAMVRRFCSEACNMPALIGALQQCVKMDCREICLFELYLALYVFQWWLLLALLNFQALLPES